eukprot:g18148.t1
MTSSNIVVASAGRTAVGSFNGAFANIPAHELGAAAIKGALARAGVAANEVDEVILGQVLPAGEGQNPARQAAMKAGVPQEATSWGANQLCGSGLRAVALGMQQIALGDAKIIVAGGQESMSMAPHCAHLRSGVKMGDFKMVDTMIKDGLTDAFYGYHMGMTAENIARQWQLSRDDQDRYSVLSQNKAEAAQAAGRFKDEIIPFVIQTRKGEVTVDQDEYIRPGATLEAMSKLRPAFDKDGTVTAANASGINDGAAAVVLMTEEEALRRGIEPLARIQAGYRVAANYFGNEETAADFHSRTGIPIFQWDVSQYEHCVSGTAEIEEKLGPIEVLVNNAGITRDNMFHKMTVDQWNEVLATNLGGVFNMTHPVWPGMRARGFGRVINISSINAQRGQAGQVNYAAAKAGDLGLTRALALEGATRNITVNAICPGYTETDMVRAIPKDVLEQKILPQIPVGRLGTPDEIARCVVFLASDDAGFITGSTLSANGGQYLG